MNIWTMSDGSWCVTPLAENGAYWLALDWRRHLTVRKLDTAECGDERASGLRGESNASGQRESVAGPGGRVAARLVADVRSWLLLAPRDCRAGAAGSHTPTFQLPPTYRLNFPQIPPPPTSPFDRS